METKKPRLIQNHALCIYTMCRNPIILIFSITIQSHTLELKFWRRKPRYSPYISLVLPVSMPLITCTLFDWREEGGHTKGWLSHGRETTEPVTFFHMIWFEEALRWERFLSLFTENFEQKLKVVGASTNQVSFPRSRKLSSSTCSTVHSSITISLSKLKMNVVGNRMSILLLAGLGGWGKITLATKLWLLGWRNQG